MIGSLGSMLVSASASALSPVRFDHVIPAMGRAKPKPSGFGPLTFSNSIGGGAPAPVPVAAPLPFSSPAPVADVHPEIEAVKSNMVPIAIGAAVLLGGVAFLVLRKKKGR
jgi:LPXTG-motif cell wall-anchored protein